MLSAARREAGMSLVEVMITLAIVGMLMALAAPSARNWIQNTQIRNSAESILTGVQATRLEALRRNTLIRFELTDANSTAWRICLYDPLNDRCSGVANAVLQEKGASEGGSNARVGTDLAQSDPTVELGVGAGMPAAVTFDSFGRPAGTAANNIMRVDVRNPMLALADERRLVIFISTGGNARMCDPKLARAANPQGCV